MCGNLPEPAPGPVCSDMMTIRQRTSVSHTQPRSLLLLLLLLKAQLPQPVQLPGRLHAHCSAGLCAPGRTPQTPPVDVNNPPGAAAASWAATMLGHVSAVPQAGAPVRADSPSPGQGSGSAHVAGGPHSPCTEVQGQHGSPAHAPNHQARPQQHRQHSSGSRDPPLAR